MFDTVGFAPQTTMSCECTTSKGSAENIEPKTTWYAAPWVAAHTVWRTRLAPKRFHNRSPASSWSSGAEEL